MTNYERGRKGEWEIRDLYLKRGWTVFRSAGSKQAADLICFPPFDGFYNVVRNKPVLIQVKRGKAGISGKERETFRALPVWAEKIVYSRKDREEWKKEVL